MRDKKRIKRLLKLIEEIWNKNPDLRLCQLIENVVHHDDNCIYHVEDDDLEKKLRDFYIKENLNENRT